MGQYWRLMAAYDSEAVTYGNAAQAMAPSPYVPDEDAQLIGLRTIVSRTAATSITNGVQFRLTCSTFKPNTLHAMAVGTGLQTVPAMPAPIIDYVVNQKVIAGVPINIEARDDFAAATTNQVYLMGLFQS